MFPNNNSNPNNTRKMPVTMIVNPYAKKRPRPNPTAPVATNTSGATPSVIFHNNSSNNSHHHQTERNTAYQQQHQHHPAPPFRTTVHVQQPNQHRPAAAVEWKHPPTTLARMEQQPAGNLHHHHASSIPLTATGRNYDSAPSLTANSSSAPGRNSSSHHPIHCNNEADRSKESAAKRDSLDSLGDSSIDWEEAIRVVDNTTAATTNQQPMECSKGLPITSASKSATSRATNPVSTTISSNPYSVNNNNKTHPNHGVVNSSVVDLTQEDTAQTRVSTTGAPSRSGTNDMSNIKESSSSTTSSMHLKKPPPVPPAHRNNMASLRPSVWSSANASSGRTKTVGTPQGRKTSPQLSQQFLSQQGNVVSSPAAHKHPMISMLPKQLQFSVNSIQPAKDDYRLNLIKHANLSKPLANGWTLFDHQKKAILKALAMRRFILALDMGLGKTLIGCVWARSFQKTFGNCKVIVICPVSLKQEWTRTATEATELQVEAEEGKPSKKKAATKKNKKKAEEKTTAHEKNSMPKVQIFSWAKVPTSIENSFDNYVVVCDEAHSIQSMQAARTKDLLTLVQPKRCVGVLLLTGTPMKNGKPSNLFPLLKAVRHPFGNHQRAYETQFCCGQQKQFGRGPAVWDAGGSSNLPQLRELISSHLLHLKKDDCLKKLPPRTRRFEHIPVSHRMQIQHTQALQEIAKLFNMSSKRDGDNSKALLAATQKLRLVSALAKVDAGVNIAKKILEEEPAVVIFTSFVNVAKSIHKKLASAGWAGELLTGEVPGPKRQAMVDNFQQGTSAVFVCTFGAGGVGLTLTAARSIILLDRPWTPGDAHQAEDRVRRIGQTHPVTSIWVTAFDVDKQIDTVLESKSETANAVLDHDYKKPQANGSSAPKISIFQLIKAILPSGGATRGSTSCVQEGGARNLSQTSLGSYYANS